VLLQSLQRSFRVFKQRRPRAPDGPLAFELVGSRFRIERALHASASHAGHANTAHEHQHEH
jgi:hypothetical protein